TDPAFSKLLGTGRLGRKAKKGFYVYEGDHRKGPDPSAYADLGLSAPPGPDAPPEEIVRRLVWPMVNEAAFCLAEGIVESPARLDLAMIFGTGFPPFRGGLCAYADAVGAAVIVDGLLKLASEKGPRFRPAPLLADYARTGRKFFND
ncbi:MAG TPA: 3-hydroxyacyl-CoA dehydrogenase family protein, partial [Thermoanaerobaculia bacterium]|nr:3-hydroxyacyl-CoA dehydrogenase family protein [Thermoanaerobaculia bacterium]